MLEDHARCEEDLRVLELQEKGLADRRNNLTSIKNHRRAFIDYFGQRLMMQILNDSPESLSHYDLEPKDSGLSLGEENENYRSSDFETDSTSSRVSNISYTSRPPKEGPEINAPGSPLSNLQLERITQLTAANLSETLATSNPELAKMLAPPKGRGRGRARSVMEQRLQAQHASTIKCIKSAFLSAFESDTGPVGVQVTVTTHPKGQSTSHDQQPSSSRTTTMVPLPTPKQFADASNPQSQSTSTESSLASPPALLDKYIQPPIRIRLTRNNLIHYLRTFPAELVILGTFSNRGVSMPIHLGPFTNNNWIGSRLVSVINPSTSREGKLKRPIARIEDQINAKSMVFRDIEKWFECDFNLVDQPNKTVLQFSQIRFLVAKGCPSTVFQPMRLQLGEEFIRKFIVDINSPNTNSPRMITIEDINGAIHSLPWEWRKSEGRSDPPASTRQISRPTFKGFSSMDDPSEFRPKGAKYR